MVRVIAISKHFKVRRGPSFQALDQVSFSVPEGEIFGLIGLSGAGKSTALRAINLIERPDTGAVFFGGEDLMLKTTYQLRMARQKIGMIFQHFNLLQNRNVEDNIAFPLKIAGWNNREIKARVSECLQLVGIEDKRKSFPSKLSGGQKQRVAIARSIANRPSLLLADEPTSALDPLTKNEILNCLLEINKRLGLTIVIATHEMNIVRRLCHRVALLKENKIHEEFGLVQGAITPGTEFGKTFWGAV